MEDKHSIIGFKGFDNDLSCRGFQYKVGKTYDLKGKVACCERGFHFCENPLEVFYYYTPNDSRFCRVEGGGNVDKSKADSKVAASHLHISSEIGLNGLIDSGLQYILNKAEFNHKKAKKTRGKSVASTTRYQSAAICTGEYSSATSTGVNSAAINSGHQSVATNTGNYSVSTNRGQQSVAANTGNHSASTNNGYHSAAINVGDSSVATNTSHYSISATTGFYSAAINVGDCSVATNTGQKSSATSSGKQSTAISTGDKSEATVQGNESVAVVTGKDSKACGTLGCWIVLTERGDFDGEINHIKEVKAFKVDGVNIKENTFYRLINGKAVEVELTR